MNQRKIPSITVVTVCYNAESTIAETIKSVLMQDYPDFEYLIIDGGSTDGTLSVVESFEDDHIHVYSEADDGISDAFNKGIKKATGEIIGLLNADDRYSENALKYIADGYLRQGADVTYGDSVAINEKSNLRMYKKAGDINDIKYELPFIHQSSFVKKSAYEKYGVYERMYQYCMDYDVMARIYHGGGAFCYVDKVISEFYYGGKSCVNPFKTIDENVSIAKKYGLKNRGAFSYRSRLYLRNAMKLVLERIHIYGFAYRILKRNKLYND